MKSSLAVLTLALGLAASAAPAAAIAPGSYSGKSDSGYKMTFKVKGNKVSRISGMVPATCISPTGGTRAGGELFRPPGKFAIGKTRKVKRKQQPAMHYSKVTKNYKVTLKRAKRGGIKAKLHVNFSFLTLDYSSYNGPGLKSWICRGDDSFTAR
jgi:hypothetical protein